MGHNLGMSHDFGRSDSQGNPCYGYMDYDDETNFWSTCSVEDFTKTDKSCVELCTSENCQDNTNVGTNDGKHLLFGLN